MKTKTLWFILIMAELLLLIIIAIEIKLLDEKVSIKSNESYHKNEDTLSSVIVCDKLLSKKEGDTLYLKSVTDGYVGFKVICNDIERELITGMRSSVFSDPLDMDIRVIYSYKELKDMRWK